MARNNLPTGSLAALQAELDAQKVVEMGYGGNPGIEPPEPDTSHGTPSEALITLSGLPETDPAVRQARMARFIELQNLGHTPGTPVGDWEALGHAGATLNERSAMPANPLAVDSDPDTTEGLLEADVHPASTARMLQDTLARHGAQMPPDLKATFTARMIAAGNQAAAATSQDQQDMAQGAHSLGEVARNGRADDAATLADGHHAAAQRARRARASESEVE